MNPFGFERLNLLASVDTSSKTEPYLSKHLSTFHKVSCSTFFSLKIAKISLRKCGTITL